jgi:hypothetical protein
MLEMNQKVTTVNNKTFFYASRNSAQNGEYIRQLDGGQQVSML